MRLIRFHDGHHFTTGLLLDTEDTRVIPYQHKRLSVRRMPPDNETEFTFLDQPTVADARRRFLEVGERYGMTREAEKHLRQ